MKKIVRILNVRKHKNVSFLDVYEKLGNRLQLLCHNSLLSNVSLTIGDILCFEGINTVNNSGLPIIEIKEIYWQNSAISWCSPKGVYNTLQSSLEEIRYNSRNAGKQVFLWQGRYYAISSIKEMLISNDFLEINCKVIEDKRTSAKRVPLEISSIHQDTPLFLRITMENQLKQACAILLSSVFSLDNVFYDKAVTANVDREVCILELVSIERSIDDIILLIKEIDTILRNIFSQFHLEQFNYSLPSDLQIVEYSDLNVHEINYFLFENTLIKNVPVSSPFVREDTNGKRYEFQWIIRGKMLGHGYDDEFNYYNLLKAVNNQKQQLDLEDCNQMDYMKYAIPRTTSLGLGIDQLLYRFWNLEHIISISNPLGIYFD